MKNKKSFCLILILILILSNSNLYASSNKSLPESSYEFYVYDEVGIVDRELGDYIIDINKEMYEKTGAQVVVAVVNDNRGMDINTLATKLYRHWGVGSKDKNNGVLMLISITDDRREIWIETGYGLEGPLPDSVQRRTVDNLMLPNFKDGDYKEGILAGFNETVAIISEEYDVSLGDRIARQGNGSKQRSSSMPFGFKLFLILIIALVILIDMKFFGGSLTYLIINILSSLGRGGGSSGGGSSGGSSGGGGKSGGGGAGGTW